MISTVTFDELGLRAFVSRKRHYCILRSTKSNLSLGLLRRTAGRCSALLYDPGPLGAKALPRCPVEVFATVATMI